MGCFDTIICKYPLPGIELPFEEQTKEFDCTLACVTIEPDGTLTRDYGALDPTTIVNEDRLTAALKEDGFTAYFDLMHTQRWISDFKRVDFTGYLRVDNHVLKFKRGKLERVDEGVGYASPFDAPAYEEVM